MHWEDIKFQRLTGSWPVSDAVRAGMLEAFEASMACPCL